MPATAQSLVEKIQAAGAAALAEAERSTSESELEQVRVRHLGKKSELSRLMAQVGRLPREERPAVGAAANRVKGDFTEAIERSRESFRQSERRNRLAGEAIDVTLPGRPAHRGRLHPLTQIMREIESVFISMGFEIALGPDLEEEHYNFDALNILPDHPSRDMHDTFYLRGGGVLRTHTTPVQIRTMLKRKPPISIIAPGKVYRCENADNTHSPVFHQIDGFLIDRKVSLGDLKGVLSEFIRRTLGSKIRYRFRPSYFPFTEPSAELDVWWKAEGREAEWTELLGSGMIHPKVLEAGGLDPEEYTGFAFGLGVERFAMMKYGIPSIRLFYENDLRFLGQF